MQNKYVGDLGDFGKYGLLRHLCPDLQLGVVWYRVGDETHNNDGRHVRYLNIDALMSARWGVKPCTASDERRHILRFRVCDPVLYDVLKELVTKGHRDIRAIPPRHILPYGTAFVEDELTVPRRDEWFARALDITKDSDVVFLDPDNGNSCSSL
jgi:hypothetical protein